MNVFKQFAVRVLTLVQQMALYARGMHPSQMWGRTFDLEKSRLVEMDGFSLFVMPTDYIGASILANRTYEPHVTAQVRRILKEGDVFVDLGANVGYFSMLASSIVRANGKVIAFEPNPTNMQLIYRSMQHRDVRNILVYPHAASNGRQILRFLTVGSNGGVVTTHAQQQRHVFLVQSVAVDEILEFEPRVDCVKMDIEAHEPFALQGMRKLIARCRPAIITEFHPWAMRLNNTEPPEAFLQQLIDLDYGLSIILPSGGLRAASTAEDVMAYWRSLRQETVHLDLLAVGKRH